MKKQLNSVSTVDTTIFTDDEEDDGGSGSGGGVIEDDDENYYQRKATISVSPHLPTPPPPPPPTIIKSKYRFSSALKSFRSRKSSTSSNKLIIRSESEMLSDEEEAEQRQPFLIKNSDGISVGKYIASGRSSTSGKLTDEEQKPRRNKATNLVKKLVGRKPKKITNIEYGRSGGSGGGGGSSGNISGGSGGRSAVGSTSGGGNTSANTTPGTIKRIPSINLYKNNNNTNINNRSNLSISESSLINIDYNKNSEKSLNTNKSLKKSTSKSLSNDKNIKLLNYNIITNNNEMLSPATFDALQSINHKLEKNKQSYNITQSIIDTWPTTMAPMIPTKLTVTTTTSNQSKTINHKLMNEKQIINKKQSQQSPATSPRMERKPIQKQLNKNEGIPTTTSPTTTKTASPTPIPITTGAIRKITKSPTVIRNEIIPIYKTPNNRSIDDGRGRRLPKSFEDQYYLQPHQHYKTQRKTEIGNNLLNPNLSGNIKSSHDNLLKLSNMKLIDDPETTEQDDDGGGGEEGEKKSLEFIVAKPKIEFEVGKLVRSPQEQPKQQQQLSSTADVDTLSSRSRTSIVISPTLSRTDDYYYSSLDTNKSSERSESSSDPKSDGSSSRRRIAYVPQPSAMIDDIYDEVMKKNLEDQTQPLSSEYSIDSEYSLPPGIDDETIMENGENMATATTSPEKREHLYKILVIGELGAGKTSFIKRYVHQFFSQNYRATIGVDFALKVLNWDQNTIIRLQLWDIAGQERFGNMTRVYYKEAVGAFIVFDVTRSSTFDAVIKWKQDLDSKVQLPNGKPIPCILLANKCDQQKQGLVNTPAKMDEYVKDNGFAGWFETSAKENINIEEAARSLVNKILLNDTLINNGDAADTEKFGLNDRNNTVPKKSCSC